MSADNDRQQRLIVGGEAQRFSFQWGREGDEGETASQRQNCSDT